LFSGVQTSSVDGSERGQLYNREQFKKKYAIEKGPDYHFVHVLPHQKLRRIPSMDLFGCSHMFSLVHIHELGSLEPG
jgi:hypothetical protein